jgi:hypothetical protein
MLRTRVLLLALFGLFAGVLCCEVQQLSTLAALDLEDTERTPSFLMSLADEAGFRASSEPDKVEAVLLVWTDGEYRSYRVGWSNEVDEWELRDAAEYVGEPTDEPPD